MQQTGRRQNTAVATEAVRRPVYSGGEDNFDSADPSLYDTILELSEMKMDPPDPDFMFNHFTVIGQVDKIEVEPENFRDAKASPHCAL